MKNNSNNGIILKELFHNLIFNNGGKLHMLKETFYRFRTDSQYRILMSSEFRKVYNIDTDVYLKLQVIDGKMYLQISGEKMDFYQMHLTSDAKYRFTLPKEVREKLGVSRKTEFDSYELEENVEKRSILLLALNQ